MRFNEWQGFVEGSWTEDIDVRDFIQKNYTPYEGDASFLAPTSEKTAKLWEEAKALIIEERKKGVLDVDTETV